MEKQYSIYDAKAKLSEIIRLVKQNRRVTITERGEPVALVIMYNTEEKFNSDERLKELEHNGILVRAKKNIFKTFKGVKKNGGLERFIASRD